MVGSRSGCVIQIIRGRRYGKYLNSEINTPSTCNTLRYWRQVPSDLPFPHSDDHWELHHDEQRRSRRIQRECHPHARRWLCSGTRRGRRNRRTCVEETQNRGKIQFWFHDLVRSSRVVLSTAYILMLDSSMTLNTEIDLLTDSLSLITHMIHSFIHLGN